VLLGWAALMTSYKISESIRCKDMVPPYYAHQPTTQCLRSGGVGKNKRFCWQHAKNHEREGHSCGFCDPDPNEPDCFSDGRHE